MTEMCGLCRRGENKSAFSPASRATKLCGLEDSVRCVPTFIEKVSVGGIVSESAVWEAFSVDVITENVQIVYIHRVTVCEFLAFDVDCAVYTPVPKKGSRRL